MTAAYLSLFVVGLVVSAALYAWHLRIAYNFYKYAHKENEETTQKTNNNDNEP